MLSKHKVDRFLALGQDCPESVGVVTAYTDLSPYAYRAKKTHGCEVHIVENRPVTIEHVCGAFASGHIIYKANRNYRRRPTYIVHTDGAYGFGDTVRAAWQDARERAWRRMMLEERIEKVKAKYPRLESRATWGELCAVHTMITGSCERGKVKWLQERGYNLRDKVTMGRFLRETESDYGNNNIKKLKEAYGRECEEGGEETAG